MSFADFSFMIFLVFSAEIFFEPIPPTYLLLSFRECVLKIKLEYLKELHEFHSDYPLVPDKLEIRRKMLPDYQLKITDDYNISTGNVKNLAPYFFYKEKYVLHYKTYNAVYGKRMQKTEFM